jgi:virginiamycin B lyase
MALSWAADGRHGPAPVLVAGQAGCLIEPSAIRASCLFRVAERGAAIMNMNRNVIYASGAAAAAFVLSAGTFAGPVAAQVTRTPQTGAGQITIFSSPGIHFSDQSYFNDGITAGPDGAVWFTNPANNTIGRISPTGRVRDYRGASISNPWAITAGPGRALWFTNFGTTSIGRITNSGKVRAFTGVADNGPVSIAAGPRRYLFYSIWASWSIGRMTTRGTSATFTAPGIVYPQNMTVGPDKAVWFTIGGADGSGYAIGRITAAGTITTYPVAQFPAWIAAGSDGALWFTYGTNAIGRITTKGVVTNYYADPSISQPGDIAAGPDGALWFINQGNNTIGRITTKGRVSHYAGSFGLANGSTITAGPDGAMWFTNSATNTIGRITTSVTPEIYAKTPTRGAPGTKVTITGRNLAHATRLTFDGVRATIISDTATRVVTIVPTRAITGRIAVTTRAGTATKNGWFVVT